MHQTRHSTKNAICCRKSGSEANISRFWLKRVGDRSLPTKRWLKRISCFFPPLPSKWCNRCLILIALMSHKRHAESYKTTGHWRIIPWICCQSLQRKPQGSNVTSWHPQFHQAWSDARIKPHTAQKGPYKQAKQWQLTPRMELIF